MAQKLSNLKESPSQTAGPYVHIGCNPSFAGIEGIYAENLGSKMITGKANGEVISIKGHVYDGTGSLVKDAMLEIWQADSFGLFASDQETRGKADPAFTGWGRSSTDIETGEYSFDTIKPGAVPYIDGRIQAPHITLWIVARGINLGLHTRIYFEDEAAANKQDPILTRIEHQNRIPTLMAKKQSDGNYLFDVILQGENETVFFDI